MAVVFNLPTTVTPIPHGRSPEPRRRETIGLLPKRDQPAPLGRSEELELIAHAVADRVHVIVTGPPNVGKSTLINEVARRQHADGQPVIFLDVAGQSVDDVLQQVFEACYHSESYKPGRGQLRELLADIEFRLIIDHLTCRPQEWASLLHAVPLAVVIAAMPPGDLPADPSRLIQLEGLDRDTALTLIGQRAGVEIGPQNIEAADAVWRATGGLPGRLLLVAAAATCGPGGSLAFPPAETLPQQTLDRLSAPEREIVTLLALSGTGGIAPQLLTELITTPENMDGALDWLTSQGLVTTGERGFRLLSGVADHLPSGWHPDPSDTERITSVLTSWVGSPGTPPRAVADHATLISAMLDLATSAGDQAKAARLAQAASCALAVSLRHGAWGDVLAHGLAASRTARDQATEAYLAHETGVQHLGSDEPEQAARRLADAASIWDRLGAPDRAEAARGNLARNGLPPPPTAPGQGHRSVRRGGQVAALCLAIMAIAGAATALALNGRHTSIHSSGTHQRTIPARHAGQSTTPRPSVTPTPSSSSPGSPPPRIVPPTDVTVCPWPGNPGWCTGYGGAQRMSSQPGSITASSDGSVVVTSITWTGWGTPTAIGKGVMQVDINISDATVTLTDPVSYYYHGIHCEGYKKIAIQSPGRTYDYAQGTVP